MVRRIVVLIAVLSSVGLLAQGRGGGQPAAQGGGSLADRLGSMQKIDGYFPLYWEERTGSLFLEIPKFDTDFLFVTGLAAGLGSNDIGLDRGIGGGGRIVHFERVGPKVFLVQPNESFRSSSPNPAERKSVADSFARSIPRLRPARSLDRRRGLVPTVQRTKGLRSGQRFCVPYEFPR